MRLGSRKRAGGRPLVAQPLTGVGDGPSRRLADDPGGLVDVIDAAAAHLAGAVDLLPHVRIDPGKVEPPTRRCECAQTTTSHTSSCVSASQTCS